MNAYWKIGIVLGWTVVCFLSGWHVKSWKDQAAAAEIVVANMTNTINAQGGVIAQNRTDNKTNYEVSNGYQNHLAVIDDIFNGLQVADGAAARDGVPGLPDATGRPNGTACANGFSQRPASGNLSAQKNAEVQAQRLIFLQEWVRRHMGQSPSPVPSAPR